MSMDKHSLDKCMSPDDAFAITLLVTCEVTKNVLSDRNNDNKKRAYWE